MAISIVSTDFSHIKLLSYMQAVITNIHILYSNDIHVYIDK